MKTKDPIDYAIENLHQIHNVQKEDRGFLLVAYDGKNLSCALEGNGKELSLAMAMAAHDDKNFRKVFVGAAAILTGDLSPE